MTKKCPACNRVVQVEEGNLCPLCGWEFKSYFKGMSDEEKALYLRKLARAIRDGATVDSSARRTAQPAQPVGSEPARETAGPGEPPESGMDPRPAQAIYREDTPVPVLDRDPFEYPEEFKARMEGHPPVIAGTAQLLKERYELESGIFPAAVQWRDWVRPLLKRRLDSRAFIRAGRDLARSIYGAGPACPVYVRLTVEGEGPVVAGAVLWRLGRAFPLEMEVREEAPAECASSVWKEPVTGMEFVLVEGGCFVMGSGAWDGGEPTPENRPHEVCVDRFWMGKYPVTQGEWRRIMGSNPSQFKLGDRRPVECVSWLDVRQFIKRLAAVNDGLHSFRLPTEAEWEYACRSGGKPEKYAGATGDNPDELAWLPGNSGGMSHEVGTKRPNGLGLYDMSGNVWEWCEDIYSDTAYDRHERSNPVCRVGEPDRVIRGGSWFNDKDFARCCSRGFIDQTYRRHYIGFRLVRVDQR